MNSISLAENPAEGQPLMRYPMRPLLITLLLLFSGPALTDFSSSFLTQQPLERVQANDIEIAYRQYGNPEHTPVIMIMGLGGSHIAWGDAMVRELVAREFRVILFDNRDTGGSTRFDEWGQPTIWWQMLKLQFGFQVDAPYTLDDMVLDTLGFMDALQFEQTHIVGISMGGMIAQAFVSRYPERTLSLVSIMSSSGADHLPPPSDEALGGINDMADPSDEQQRRETESRGFYADAIPRQLMAIFHSGDRSGIVARITRPTLVIHGAEDQLLPLAHGLHTAELIPNADLQVYENMAHNLPTALIPDLVRRMANHMRAATATGAQRSPDS